MEFRNVLKELRLEKGFSQKKLGEMLFMIDTTITNWEKGRAEPNIETLKRIAEIFDVSLDYLCGRTDKLEVLEPYTRAPTKRIEGEILGYFSMLSNKNKLTLLGFVKGLLEGQKNQDS